MKEHDGGTTECEHTETTPANKTGQVLGNNSVGSEWVAESQPIKPLPLTHPLLS